MGHPFLVSEKLCPICQVKFNKGANVYCGRRCYEESRVQDREKKFKMYDSTGVIPPNVGDRTVKLYVLSRNGHRCSICNNTTWQGKNIPLVLDHIDGRASNQKISNLRLVCGNCDMQLPTYKSKNKNSDRKDRYLRSYSSGSA